EGVDVERDTRRAALGRAGAARSGVCGKRAPVAAGAGGTGTSPGADGAGAAGGGAERVGAEPQRLRERVLQRGGALDEHELARLPVRVAGQDGADDRRQASARAVDPGAVGAAV